MKTVQVLVVCTLLGTTALGQEARDDSSAALTAPHWEIAPEFSWFRYEEPDVMHETGMLYGVAGSYTHYYKDNFQKRLARVEGEVAAGEVDYDGSLSDGTPYTMEGNSDFLLNLRALWAELWRTSVWENQFYFGLGYRFLNDDSTHDIYGYERYSNYLYVPLGLKTYHGLGGNWSLGLAGEFDVLLIGLQVSGRAATETEKSNIKNWQWPGFGARGTIELRHQSPSLDLAVAPFIQYWWVADSQESSDGTWVWYEPENNSIQAGLNVIWRF
jgi:hypothetical protein